MEDLLGLGYWLLLFGALYYRPPQTTVRDWLMGLRRPRTDP